MHKFSSRVIMEASASSKTNADSNGVYGFFITAIDHNNFPSSLHQNNTVIKYTRLPDFEIDSNVSCPLENYTLQPRVRRLITLDDAEPKTNRSLKLESMNPGKMTTKIRNRKIVTIAEDDENDLHPKFSSERKRTPSGRSSSRSVGVDFNEEKHSANRTISRLTNVSKYTKEVKVSAKINSANSKKEVNVIKHNYRSKHNPPVENMKSRFVKDKELLKNTKTNDVLLKTSLSKNLVTSSESERDLTNSKNKLCTKTKCNDPHKKTAGKSRVYTPPAQNMNRLAHCKEPQSKIQSISVIRVPLDNRQSYQEPISNNKTPIPKVRSKPVKKVDCGSGHDEVRDYKHVNINTEPLPKTVDQLTDMDGFALKDICKCVESTVQTEAIKEHFDSLEIPNVTLTKDKKESNEPLIYSTSALPTLEVPVLKIASHKEEFSSSDIDFCEKASYIISRATLTYTTRQKINFHVVGTNEGINSNLQTPSPLAYPMNVVSVFKNELKSKESDSVEHSDDNYNEHTSNAKYTSCLNELKSLNCSYIFNSDKLMKPSDIISTIRVNNGLLPSDYICEQFQRELNFIDSFFESLQYLESCSLSDKCLSDDKVENLVNTSVLFDPGFDVKSSEYDHFLSKIENGASTDDSDTMASKSLCLLNLLIRDEQRRAKNLLFVLKMREDALKDFTKSQILWLEKKKKHENTDISTLKKKQRGALLKLQHECGEMQRMRKALLTLSEKRKVALMKTKKNIELKLKNNVDVEQIILGKKKLKRNTSGDRNTTPLKCFDLSSSGCEDSSTSRPTSDAVVFAPVAVAPVTSAEKCIQTGDSVLGSASHDQSTNTAAENFVGVDGGYLNIVFHDLMLPQIFSSGKQYEVNEEALKNIVHSSNNHKDNFGGCDLEKLVEQIKNRDLDSSSSPSTARSLVDEFDQYYKNLADDDKSPVISPDRTYEKICEIKDVYVQTPELNGEDGCHSTSTTGSGDDSMHEVESSNRSWGCDPMEDHVELDRDMMLATSQTQTGPLPVPVGAAAPDDPPTSSIPVWVPPKSSESTMSESDSVSSQPLCASASSLASLSSPVICEAEELRRQQLAIEREIKALEQQQCRLLVVREIPDKPPPPYTPPAETRVPKPQRDFSADSTVEEKIENLVTDSENVTLDPTDPFDLFLRDFCQETLERHKSEQSDKPWDACNLLPQKATDDEQKLGQKVTGELKEILKGAVPTVVSGFSSRRSDHIDDILFTEWRRCEPEWTNLHTDEAIVKNQLFESIFQKILTETIDEYRHTVKCTSPH